MKEIKTDNGIKKFTDFILESADSKYSKEELYELAKSFSVKDWFNFQMRQFADWESEIGPFEEDILTYVNSFKHLADTNNGSNPDFYDSINSALNDLDTFICDKEYLICDGLDTAVYFSVKYPDLDVLPLIEIRRWPEGGVDSWEILLKSKNTLREYYNTLNKKYVTPDSFDEEVDIMSGKINFENYKEHITRKCEDE